jgi:hypothetical protein
MERTFALILASFDEKSMEHSATIFNKISGEEGRSIVLFIAKLAIFKDKEG